MNISTVVTSATLLNRQLTLVQLRKRLLSAPMLQPGQRRSRRSCQFEKHAVLMLRIAHRLERKGSDSDVSCLEDAAALLMQTNVDHRVVEGLLDALRYNAELYEDGDDFRALYLFHAGTILFLIFGGIWTVFVICLMHAHPSFLGISTKRYVLAYWAGGLGSAIAFITNANDHAVRAGETIIMRAARSISTPAIGVVCGMIGLMALYSGLLNVMPRGVNEKVFDFLACAAFGYSGLKGLGRFQFIKQVTTAPLA